MMDNKKVLVTGANGFIGRHLCQLLTKNRTVVAAVRSRVKPVLCCDCSEVFYTGSLSDHLDWSPMLADVDVVVHLAGRAHKAAHDTVNDGDLFHNINCEASVSLLRQAAKSGVKRFIFLSSIGVIGNLSKSEPLSELSKCSPGTLYAKSKYDAEQCLKRLAKELNIELVIIRPPLVYGFDAPGNFASLIKLVKQVSFLPFGLVDNRKSFISVINLVNFIDLCICHPKAANQTFVIADDQVVSTRELTDCIAQSFSKKLFQIPISPTLLRIMLKFFGRESVAEQLLDDLVIDNSKAKFLLSWHPCEQTRQSLSELFMKNR